MSWAGPQLNGVRAKRRTGFIGNHTEAKAAKAADAQQRPNATAEPHDSEVSVMPTLYEFARGRLADPLAPRAQLGTDRYASAYKIRIHAALGAYRLNAITARRARDWCDELVRREGDRDCAMFAIGTLLWLLNEAVDEGLLVSNVAAGIKFRRRAKSAVLQGAPSAADYRHKKPTLTSEQYGTLKVYAATLDLVELVKVRMPTEGTLRRGELAALRWEGFDAEARTFGVSNGVTYTKTTGTVVGPLKNEPSYRVVVLSRDLRDLLVRYRAECVGGGLASHFLFPGRRDGRSADPTSPQVPNSLTKRVCDLIQRAGIVAADGSHFTDLQGLRATGSSLADAAGVTQALIDAQMGHKGSTVYQRHYRDVSTVTVKSRETSMVGYSVSGGLM